MFLVENENETDVGFESTPNLYRKKFFLKLKFYVSRHMNFQRRCVFFFRLEICCARLCSVVADDAEACTSVKEWELVVVLTI